MQSDIVNKFTTHLKNVLTRALVLASETEKQLIAPEHILLALSLQQGSISSEILHKANLKPEKMKCFVGVQHVEPEIKNEPTEIPLLSDEAKRILEKAVLTASIYEHKYVGTEHLLSGLLQAECDSIQKFLASEKVDVTKLKEQIAAILRSTSRFPEFTESIPDTQDDVEIMMFGDDGTEEKQIDKQRTPALDYFARDLTTEKAQKTIDPVIARESEIERVMEILSRRTKNNPLLLGEAGVGKTAIVEGLAKKILEGEVPAVLQGKRILALDMALVLAGTMYRGEFEERLRQVIDEVKADSNIILFIDEVHGIIGAGASSGSLDAANILKPALARGDIRCIGATTPQEYKKHIETDAALERRFQPVIIHEPSQDDTRKILTGISEYYENYHNVKITKEAIEAAVEMSVRFIQNKFLPDKAIDLIDEAAAAYRIANSDPDYTKRIQTLESQLAKVSRTKRLAVVEEKFVDARQAKEKETELTQKIAEFKKNTSPVKEVGQITKLDISKVVAKQTGIPVGDLVTEDHKRLIDLGNRLNKVIIGQAEPVEAVADAIRRSKTGISHPDRPLASFLFLGPSGVGKTELAKALAREVFHKKSALVQLDMSEFAEGYTVSKLIGSPAGYVGYRESARLTGQVKQRPYCVVLFDELEKAHPDVQNLLLQILESGELTESTGRKINFKNTIIVITSNIGLERFQSGGIGFNSSEKETTDRLKDDVGTELEDRFRPELVNRVDRICMFNPLSQNNYVEIAKKQLDELVLRLSLNGVKIVYNSKVVDQIAAQAASSRVGARQIRRIITNSVEAGIANKLLKNPDQQNLLITWRKDTIVVHNAK